MSKLNINHIGPHTEKHVTVLSDLVISGSTTVGNHLNVNESTNIGGHLNISGKTTVHGPLVVLGDFIVSGNTEFNDVNTITDVFSNHRNISHDISLSGNINSFIFGDDIIIDPDSEIVVDEDVNLTIFGPEDLSDKQISTDVISYGKEIIEDIVLNNELENSMIFGDEIAISEGNELVVENDLTIFGEEDFSDKQITTNVISNPKVITDDVNLEDNTSSMIVGEEIEIAEGYEIEIQDGSDLLIFDANDFVFDGTSTSPENPIENLYTTNINTTNINVTDTLVSENIIVNNNLYSNFIYGDGSGITNVNTDLPLTKSEGQNSFKQIGDSIDVNLGKNSSSLGDFNKANGDYSNIVGSNNITGTKGNEFFKIPNTNYLLVLGNGSHASFGIQPGGGGPIQLSATCTGSTVINSLRYYIKNSVPYMNDCFQYRITYNRIVPCDSYNYVFNYYQGATAGGPVVYKDCSNQTVTIQILGLTGAAYCVKELISFPTFFYTSNIGSLCSGSTTTLPSISVTYTDCQTNTLQTTTSFTRPICSKTIPTYTIPAQYSAYTDAIESAMTITRIGKCCENIIITSAVTLTTKQIKTTATTYVSLFNTACTRYNVWSTGTQRYNFTYTPCNSTSAVTIYNFNAGLITSSGYNFCSSTPPTWNGPIGAFTVSSMGNCCSYWKVRNRGGSPITWPITDCYTGAITNVTILPGKEYGACSAYQPPFANDYVTQGTGGEFCRTNTKVVCTSQTITEKSLVVTSACSISSLIVTGDCVTYRFTNTNQTVPTADDNIFWTDCDGIQRSEKLTGYQRYYETCAIKNSASAISGITITQVYSGCCLINTNSPLEVIHHFSGNSIPSWVDGYQCIGTLHNENGVLYGTTYKGGDPNVSANGTIFSCNTDGSGYEIVFNCQTNVNQPTGANPYPGPFKGSDGRLWGTSDKVTVTLGLTSHLSVYAFNLTNRQFTSVALTGWFIPSRNQTVTPIHGAAKLMERTSEPGFLYGVSHRSSVLTGGNSIPPSGLIYKIEMNTLTYTYLFDLSVIDSSCYYHYTQLYETSSDPNALYGTSFYGGTYDSGIIFRYDIISGTATIVHNFNPSTDGSNPGFTEWAEKNGVLYGVTSVGGAYDSGTLFSYDPNRIPKFIKIFDFPGGVSVGAPKSLMFASDGKIYGTAGGGDYYGYSFGPSGSIYSYDLDRNFYNLIHTFSGPPAEPRYAVSTLIEINGCLYGGSIEGGRFSYPSIGQNLNYPYGAGTVFKLCLPTCATSASTLHSVTETIDGVYTIVDIYNYNATAFDGKDKSYFDVLSITKGITNSSGSIIDFDLDNLPANTEYVLLEINPDLPSTIDTGLIVSNQYGNSASAEGLYTHSKGNASHSEGISTIAEGDASHAEGHGTQSKGMGSHAEGFETISMGEYSHSEGLHNEAGSGFILSTFDGVDTFTIKGKDLSFSFNGNYLYTPSNGKFAITNVGLNDFGTIITIDPNSPTGSIFVTSGDTYVSPETWCNENKTFTRCYLCSNCSYNGQINRNYWDKGVHVFTILELTVNGVYYGSGHTMTLTTPSDLMVGIGTDENSYVTNITDWVNGLLPSGFMFLNDMKAVDKPIGASFNLVIDYTDPITGNLWQYYYNSELGYGIGYNYELPQNYYQYDCYDYTCVDVTDDLVYFGNYSHTEGSYNKIFNNSSHAEGFGNEVYGEYSHAEGSRNIVIGNGSHAEGLGTIALGNYQHISGHYNLSGNTTSLFVVGNGFSNEYRSDVLQVDADKVKIYEVLNIVNIQEYSDNSDAIANNLVAGDVYRTGEYLKIVY